MTDTKSAPRLAFEAWAWPGQGLVLRLESDGQYWSHATRLAWEAWQAALGESDAATIRAEALREAAAVCRDYDVEKQTESKRLVIPYLSECAGVRAVTANLLARKIEALAAQEGGGK